MSNPSRLIIPYSYPLSTHLLKNPFQIGVQYWPVSSPGQGLGKPFQIGVQYLWLDQLQFRIACGVGWVKKDNHNGAGHFLAGAIHTKKVSGVWALTDLKGESLKRGHFLSTTGVFSPQYLSFYLTKIENSVQFWIAGVMQPSTDKCQRLLGWGGGHLILLILGLSPTSHIANIGLKPNTSYH